MKQIMHKINGWFLAQQYAFIHWFFQWEVDEDGDIAFKVASFVRFIKYKEHTVVLWRFKKNWTDTYKPAPKWILIEI